jgi:hypothetical protein
MSSISPPSPRRLEDLHREIDSYASLITKDFVAHGRRITREFEYDGEPFMLDGKCKYRGQRCRIDLPDEGIRFSVEVTEIFRSYLPLDERTEMRWTFYFNTRPDIRQIAITEAFKRMYPPAGMLPVLSPRPPTARKSQTSLPRSLPETVSVTGSSSLEPLQKPRRTCSTMPLQPTLTGRPSSAKAGHFTSIPEKE